MPAVPAWTTNADIDMHTGLGRRLNTHAHHAIAERASRQTCNQKLPHHLILHKNEGWHNQPELNITNRQSRTHEP
jgi:hypothetical protein